MNAPGNMGNDIPEQRARDERVMRVVVRSSYGFLLEEQRSVRAVCIDRADVVVFPRDDDGVVVVQERNRGNGGLRIKVNRYRNGDTLIDLSNLAFGHVGPSLDGDGYMRGHWEDA